MYIYIYIYMYIYKCPFSIAMLVYQRVSIQCHPNVFRLPIWFAEINLATGEFSCSMPAELPENFLVTPNNNSSLPQLSCSPQAIYGIYSIYHHGIHVQPRVHSQMLPKHENKQRISKPETLLLRSSWLMTSPLPSKIPLDDIPKPSMSEIPCK